MIVRSAPHLVASSLPAHPIVYGPVPRATHTTSAPSRFPTPASERFPAPLLASTSDLPLTTSSPTAVLTHQDCDPVRDLPTDHAGLVLLGKYAQHLGLIECLRTVPPFALSEGIFGDR
jgi:hypothetical protein